MSAKPKLRWYQFSLRGLLIATALVSFPLARITFLLQMADYHQAQERLHFSKIDPTDLRNAKGLAFIMQNEDDRKSAIIPEDQKLFIFREGREAIIHGKLAREYRRTAYRPWFFVDMIPPPEGAAV